MKEWKTYKVGDICSSISETYKSKSKSVVLINTSDVLEGRCLNHEFVPNKDLKGQFKKVFKFGDILYSEIRPANKRFAYIDFDATDYIASTKLMVLRNNDKVTNRFLYHYLKSESTIAELQALAESRSGTFPQITFSELSQLEISIPDIETQLAISSFIDTLESKIELNRQINDNLEQQAQALYKSWFIDFEPFKDGKFEESEIGLIPEGWHVGKAGDFYEINIGKTPPRKEHEWFTLDKSQNIWISISDLGLDGRFLFNSSEYLTDKAIQKHNIVLVPEDTVLLSFKLTIGRVGIAGTQLTTNEAIARFITNSVNREYTYFLLKNFNYSKLGSTSSIATAVNSKIIKAMIVLMPSNECLLNFKKLVGPIIDGIKKNEEEILRLTALRDNLLPKLMSGELKINEIDC